MEYTEISNDTSYCYHARKEERKDMPMTTNEMIENVRSSFAMENMPMTPEDEARGKSIMEGTSNIEQVVEEIKLKYMSIPKTI